MSLLGLFRQIFKNLLSIFSCAETLLCVGFSLVEVRGGNALIVLWGLLFAVASRVVEHRL